MYKDHIDLTLPEAHLQQIVSFLLGSEELLSSLRSVTPTERKHLAKLGLKNETLARDIIEVGRANLDLIPRGIDFGKIDRDLIARDQLRSLKFLLERLLGKVKDSLLLTGVDLYAAALSIYHSLRRNGDYGNLKDVVDELKKGFARPSRRKKGEEQPETPQPLPSIPQPALPPPSPVEPATNSLPAAENPAALPRLQEPEIAPSPVPTVQPNVPAQRTFCIVEIGPERCVSHAPLFRGATDHPLLIPAVGGVTALPAGAFSFRRESRRLPDPNQPIPGAHQNRPIDSRHTVHTPGDAQF